MDLKIIVATHKEYDIPEKEYFLPVHAGASISNIDLPYQKDNVGINISNKNKTYCELTALYWAYKNLKADYIGLCHYRRYFDLENIDISKYKAILPKKRYYYIETVYDQFKHAHNSIGLDTIRKILNRDYPNYIDSFDKQMNHTSLHIYNMFIMKYDLFIDYCDFLFDVLEKTEKELGDIDRIYGYLGERLLDVYLDKNNIEYKEVNIINTERVNWIKKIFDFLVRKFR